VHLDLHVDDLAAEVSRAVGLGATLLTHTGHAVLRSPGGLTFCLVVARTADPVRPTPVTGPRGGVSLVDQIALDVPGPLIATERAFWTALTGWSGATGDGADGTAGGPTTGAVLEPLTRPAGMPLRLLLHRLGTDDPGTRVRAHLDLAAGPHRERVVAEHVDAGARVLRRHERWTVLVDPAGLPYCVTDRSPVTGLLPSVADRDELAR
jgi:hypothetical protein